MKQYHTEIIISRDPDAVWAALTEVARYPDWNPLVGWLKGELVQGQAISMFIKPLNRSFRATLTRVVPGRELRWVGVQIANWIISGEHYYQLEAAGPGRTRLLHGETFRGVASALISAATLDNMRQHFELHNQQLKRRLEHV